MTKQRCEHCKFYEPDDIKIGTCHRHAPSPIQITLQKTCDAAWLTAWFASKGSVGEDEKLTNSALYVGDPLETDMARWPMVTGAEDWCGEFAERVA